MANSELDIAICGAGPVGMALAALLAQRGLPAARIGLLDQKTLAQASLDPRALALSYGSRQILEQIGAWPIEATPIHQIHVSRRGYFGRSLIDCADHDLPALGYVTRYGALVSMLGAVCERAGVRSLRPVRVQTCLEDAHGVKVGLADGATLAAKLLVQAEGGLFGAQQERAVQRDYQQTALIAQVQVSAMQRQRAYERFTGEGPLALLPQGDAYALVWCMRPATAQRMLALDDAAFLAELERAFGSRLGRFISATPRLAYRLGLNAEARHSGRTVSIGNAAQTLHPVAGQGFNLGLRDAAVLARTLAQGSTPEHLSAFSAQRQRDRQSTINLTDAMARAFTGAGPLQMLTGGALGLLDVVGPARTVLAELMLYGRR